MNIRNMIFAMILVALQPISSNGTVVNRVEGDYDGDGRMDIGIAYVNTTPRVENWHIFPTSAEVDGNRTPNKSTYFGYWGASCAVPADWDNDGKTDMALYDPVLGILSINRSKYGMISRKLGPLTSAVTIGNFHRAGQVDFRSYEDGVCRTFTNNGRGVISNNSVYSQWIGTGTPFSGDFDGDGLDDQIVFNDRTWEVTYSGENSCAFSFEVEGIGPNQRPVVKSFSYNGQSEVSVSRWFSPAPNSIGYVRNPVLSRRVSVAPISEVNGSSIDLRDVLRSTKLHQWKFFGKKVRHVDGYINKIPNGTKESEIDSVLLTMALSDRNCDVLLIGNRTYVLSSPIHVMDRRNLLIVGTGSKSMIYSGKSKLPLGVGTQYESTNQVKWTNGSALSFRNCENITIRNLHFVGRSLDRRVSQYVSIPLPNGETWTYQTPSSETNVANSRALSFLDVSNITVDGCVIEHYTGSGIYLVNLTKIGENISFRNNTLVDCLNFRNPLRCYVSYDTTGKIYRPLNVNNVRTVCDEGAIQINSANVPLTWIPSLRLNGLEGESELSTPRGAFVGLLRTVKVSNNSIRGALMDGIFVNSLGIYDLQVNGNYVYGYNTSFSLPLSDKMDANLTHLPNSAQERASEHSSEMGIAVNVSGGGMININDNYIAGWGAEGIAVGPWGPSYVYLTRDPIIISRNRIFDCGYRGIGVYGAMVGNLVETELDEKFVELREGVVTSTTGKIGNIHAHARIEHNYMVQTPDSDFTPNIGFDSDFSDTSNSRTRVSLPYFRYIEISRVDEVSSITSSTNWYASFGFDGKLTWSNVVVVD